MATSSRAHVRKRLAAKPDEWAALQQRAISAWQALVPWWKAQADHRQLAIVAVAFVVFIGAFNVSGIGRSTAVDTAANVPAPVAHVLTAEAAPTVPGKAWVATQLWQGSGARATESFTVGSHWRVDWLYNPPAGGGILQVFIYSANGAVLMDTAANTQQSGADSSFWAGPGTYFLKVNSTGGDWKLDVQDIR
jgi:hypothetical protein